MENFSRGALGKNNEHYLQSKDKAEKQSDILRHIQWHMSKKQNEDLQSIMSNLQLNCCLKVDSKMWTNILGASD